MPRKLERACSACGEPSRYSMCRACERRMVRELKGDFRTPAYDEVPVRAVGYEGRETR